MTHNHLCLRLPLRDSTLLQRLTHPSRLAVLLSAKFASKKVHFLACSAQFNLTRNSNCGLSLMGMVS